MPEKCRFRILKTTEELENFRNYWAMLWNIDPNATPFQHPGWLLPWWHQFGRSELRGLTISRNGVLIAFLPFYIYHDPIRSERQLLLLGAGTSDYLDGIFAPDCRMEDIKAALYQLFEMEGWDIGYTFQLRAESILFKALEQTSCVGTQPLRGENCSQIRTPSLREAPVKIRRNAMYYRNRAQRQGSLRLETADRSDLLATFDTLVRLHTARWQSQGQAGVLADSRVLACHREAIPELHRLGLIYLSSLFLNDEIIATAYSLVDRTERRERRQYLYLTAYSIKHGDLRPGTLLLASMLEDARTKGISTIDLLRGEESYKQLWRAESIPTFGFVIRRNIREKGCEAA